jgi:glycosyltransferase involved in cell wall biosynthesis
MTGGIAVVTSGFPRRSETFALNELLALDRAGALAGVYATKAGESGPQQPDASRLGVRVLPPGTPREQASALAAELDGLRVAGVHGYFAHRPAEVAALAAYKLGVPFGFSVHARDARKLQPSELAERAAAAACVIACNVDAGAEVERAGGRADVVPHGVDLARFRPREVRRADPPTVLAVGRLVEKKGFHILLDAAARLSFPFRLRIVGEGPERARLDAAVADHGLSERVELIGAVTHAELRVEYGAADIVVAPSLADGTGDRDGLPNVVLEAMACGLPVIGGDVGAMASALDGETGLLVPPGDAASLAEALELLARQPALRARIGRAARSRVERDFDLERCAERFVLRLRAAYA